MQLQSIVYYPGGNSKQTHGSLHFYKSGVIFTTLQDLGVYVIRIRER